MPPKPVSFFGRVAGIARRLRGWVACVAVFLAAFLLVPLQGWDDYLAWQGVRDSLERLSARPDSLPEFRNALSVANSAGLLWAKPSGERPAKWYQAVERERFDASYGVVQALAVGVVTHGKAERGLEELAKLKRRTGIDCLGALPNTAVIAPPCSGCQKGTNVAQCSVCGGDCNCVKCGGKGVVVSSKAGTQTGRIPAKRLSDGTKEMSWTCPVCNGSKKCGACKGAGGARAPCAVCRGAGVVVDCRAATNVFYETVQGALCLIDEGQPHRRAIHTIADIQRRLLREGKDVGQRVLSATPLDGAADGDAQPTPEGAAAEAAPAPAAPLPRAGQAKALDVFKFGQGDDEAERDPSRPLELRLSEACDTLLRSPLDVAGLTTLSEAARNAASMPEVRSRAMVAYALAHLMRGDTNSFASALRVHDAEYPGQARLLTITPSDYVATCEACSGIGNAFTPCPSCTGPNSCPECKGKGVVSAGDGLVPCKACKYKPVCKMCEGQRKMLVRCPSCKGGGRVFKLGPRVQGNYESLVNALAALCKEEVAFGEQLATAAGEKDLGQRIRLLQAATNQFAGRVDLARAAALFAAADNESRARRSGPKEPSARAPDLPPLPAEGPIEIALLDKFVQAQDVGPAVETLRGYLAEHPSAPSADEVKKALGRLEQRRQRGLAGRMGAAGGAVAVAVAAILLVLWRKTRRPARREIALPGMGRINADAFTDPLSLTAQESRTHARGRDDA